MAAAAAIAASAGLQQTLGRQTERLSARLGRGACANQGLSRQTRWPITARAGDHVTSDGRCGDALLIPAISWRQNASKKPNYWIYLSQNTTQ